MAKKPIADAPYVPLLHPVDCCPIFIMGMHRSGTTLLYQLLSETNAFNVVTLYHILKYDEILWNYYNGADAAAKAALQEQLQQLGITDRRFDRVRVSPELPEEYGYLLYADNMRKRLAPRSKATFVELCQKVQYTAAAAKPLLLKNPHDFDNFLYIQQQFPGARYIFIHRHPLAVINSQLRALHGTFAQQNPYSMLLSPEYPALFQTRWKRRLAQWVFNPDAKRGARLLTRRFQRAISYYQAHYQQLGDRYIAIRYEDLCTDPTATMQKIQAFLDIPMDLQQHYTPIQPRPLSLLPGVERTQNWILRRTAAYCAQYGYAEAPIPLAEQHA